MSSSEASSYAASGRQEVLYKVFVHRAGEKNPPLDKEELEEMFASVIEPFKVNVPKSGEYGFAYFGSRRDARACIAAFHKQPPFYYSVYVGQPEVVPMSEKDLKRLSLELQYKAKRLEIINLQMRELRLEKSKLTNDLGALSDYCGSDTELEEIESDVLLNYNSEQGSYLSDAKDEELRLDKKRLRDKSRSRVSEILGQHDKSEHRRDKSEHRRDKSLHRQQSFNSTTNGRQSRYSMNVQHNSNIHHKDRNTRHSLGSTSSNGYQKTSTNVQERISRVSSANKENIRSFSSKQQSILVETVPTDRFVQATIQYINTKKNEIWVSLTSNNEKLNKINDLLAEAPKHRIIPAYDIHINCYCIVEFNGNGIWYRAQVIDKHESDINILRLIDYGNQITCIDALVKMPECLYEIPAQAIQISNSSLNLEQLNTLEKINIRTMSNNNNITYCEISSTTDVIKNFENKFLNNTKQVSSFTQANKSLNSKQSATPGKKVYDKRECIINSLSLAHRGTLKLKTVVDSKSCIAQLTIMGDDFSNYVQAIQNIWEKYPTEYIQPVAGDLVCVENDVDEGWSRGYVMDKLNASNGYRIALIDDGIYMNNVTKCCKLLPEHVRIPDFACLCEVIDVLCNQQQFMKLFAEDKTYSFIITEVDVEGTTNIPYVKCTLKDRKTKENICELKLSSWILSMKQDSTNHIDSNGIQNVDNQPNPNKNFKQTDVNENQSNSGRNYNQKRNFDNQQTHNRNNQLYDNQQTRNKINNRPFDSQQTHNRNNNQSFDNQQSSNTNYRQQKDFNNQQIYNTNNNQTNYNTATNQQQSFMQYDGIIPKVNLPSESIVMVAFIESQQTVFVKYRESAQHLKKVTELIQSVSKLAPMNLKLAKIGKCVAAQYSEDQQWYRGEILSIDNDTNIATVLYIDYGNKEEVNINETKMLSQSLLDIPRALVEIKLHDLPNKPFTLAQAKYLDQCMASKPKFKMILNALQKGVQLINDLENFNEKLLSLSRENNKNNDTVLPKEVEKVLSKEVVEENVKPTQRSSENISIPSTSSSQPKSNQVTPTETNITIPSISSSQPKSNQVTPTETKETVSDAPVDIPFVDLPLGKTTIIFQNVLEAEERVIVCYPDDAENLLHVQQDLTLEIHNYLEINDEETSYKPDLGAPCIAKFEDSWYRGLCLANDNEDDSAIIMFVDFGNHEKVKFTDIRKLPKQFLKDPAIALICTVMDVPSDVSAEDFLNSLVELERYEVDVIEKEDEAQYKIHIPGISAVN
ncbi:protein PF14_0175-like isoform X1 [Chrysoperla carnea]|uniref:protein PF14_0175-like isoform X1 n=1 Tax=Chrysoperla carnea TaxID=189513 RepID=UPI001D06B8D9|nr:protein PF14_0175-like isoform X1 [Chrysoperla carnea]